MIQTYDEAQAAAVTICILFVKCLGLFIACISLAVPHSSREWEIMSEGTQQKSTRVLDAPQESNKCSARHQGTVFQNPMCITHNAITGESFIRFCAVSNFLLLLFFLQICSNNPHTLMLKIGGVTL